jgi:hypothetical protein
MALCMCVAIGVGRHAGASAATSAEMQAVFESMRGKPVDPVLRRPMQLISVETPKGLAGEVYAAVDRPLASLETSLDSAAAWCRALLLHVDNRACQVSREGDREVIGLSVVRRYDLPVEDAYRSAFTYSLAQSSADRFEATLTAPSGPFGTSNYRIVLEAIALDGRRSFLHFSYAYDEGFLTRNALKAYLATFGRGKVGFTVLGTQPDGAPYFIGGTRGLMERNAMRYFLAVEACLGAAGVDPAARAMVTQEAWFAGTEEYPRQLHEIDLPTYMAVKRNDEQRRAATK